MSASRSALHSSTVIEVMRRTLPRRWPTPIVHSPTESLYGSRNRPSSLESSARRAALSTLRRRDADSDFDQGSLGELAVERVAHQPVDQWRQVEVVTGEVVLAQLEAGARPLIPLSLQKNHPGRERPLCL